jgi:hypothetical protein
MHMRQLLLAATFVFASVGCVGGITGDDVQGDDGNPPGDDGGGDSAKVLFERDVYPIVSVQCGAGCHLAVPAGSPLPASTPFVAMQQSGSYENIVGFDSVVGNFTQEGAPIWTKIMTTPLHNARSYTTDQQTKIAGWLAKEVADRQIGGPPPVGTETAGQATARLIAEWRGCLLVTDFTDLRFGETWANKGSTQGNCEVCHSTGAYGMYANDDNTATYDVLSGSRENMLFFFAADVSDPMNRRMVTNGQHFITLGQRLPPHQEHPAFDPNQATGGGLGSPLQALQDLYDRTMQHKTDGTCAPPITD